MALQFLNDGYFAGKVGIGTESPDRKLHVNSGSTNIVATFESTDATAAISLQDNSTTNDSKVQIRAIGDDFNIVAGGSQRVTVNSSGNVGIGKTSPSSKLHIKQSVDNIDGGLTWESVDGTQEWSIDANNAGNFRIYKGTTAIARFDSSGNFGIGTTSPTQKLHVAGNARVTGAYYDSNNSPGTANQVLVSTVTGTDWVDGSTIPGVPAGSGTLNTIPLWTPDGDTLGNSIITQPSTSTIDVDGNILISDTSNDKYFGSNVNLILNADADGNSGSSARNIIFQNRGSEKMRIDSEGSVGIGTTTPDSKLQIMNNDGSSYRFGYGGSSDVYLDADNVYIRTDNGGANTATFTTTGLGIGTTSPQSTLHVDGDIRRELDGTSTIGFGSGSTSAWYSGIKTVDFGAQNVGLTLFTTTNAGTTNVDALTIDEDGNVGIGTTSPDARLMVKDSSDSGFDSGIAIIRSANSQTGYINMVGGAMNFNSPSIPITFRQGGAEKIRIISDGSVGIGTTSPSAKLDIGGNTAGSVQAIFGRGNSDSSFTVRYTNGITGTNDTVQGTIGLDYANGYWADMAAVKFIRDSTAGELAFYTSSSASNGTERMRITSGGNVGIGTTSPDTNLEIESSTGGVLRLTSSNTTVLTDESIGKIEFKSNDASTGGNNVMGFIDSVATNVGTRYALSFGTGDAAAAVERMRITNLGGISFGSTGTAYGTSGQILKSNANASPTWIDGSAIPGVPAGSGAAGQVTVWSGTDVITGYTRFKVYDAGGQIQITDGTRDIRINSGYAGSTAMIGTSSSHDLGFMTGNSQRVTIDTSGNVGIGTTSPVGKLNINTGLTGITYDMVNQDNGSISFSNNSGGTAAPAITGKSNNNLGLMIISGTNNTGPVADMYFDVRENDNTDYATLTSSAYRFNRFGNPLMTILRSGNVGIGTTNIGTQSNLYLGASSSSEGGQITLQKATGGTLAAHIDAYTSGGTDFMRVLSGTDTATTAAPFVFNLTDTRLGIGTTSPGNKLHVVEGTSTWETAEFQSSSTTGCGITLVGANVSGLQWSMIANASSGGAGVNNLGFHLTGVGSSGGSAGYKMTIQASSGNVGIGTTSPQQKLHINGNVRVGTDTGFIDFARPGGAIVGGIGWHTDDYFYVAGHPTAGTGAGNNVRVYAFGSLLSLGNPTAGDALTVAVNGNIGIGTTSPSTLISNSSVRNAAASGLSTSLKGLNIEVPAGGNSQGYVASFANTQTASNNYNAGVLIEVGSTDTTTRLLSVESGGTNRLEVRGDGNVGIGTGTPTEGRLHVTQSYSTSLRTGYFQSSAYSAPHVVYDSFAVNQQDVPCLVLVETPSAAVSTHQKLTLAVGDNNAVIRTANTSGGMWFNVNGGISDSGYLTTSGTNALRLLNNGNAIFPGNVGIGTTSPGTKLVIEGANDAAGTGVVEIKTTGTNLKIGGNTTYSWIQSHASKPLYINQLGNNVILNLGGGRVGIGTAGPSQKLHVVGNLRVTGAYYDSNNSAGTSGQVLSSTASGTDWVDVLTGSGTSGVLPKWNSAGTALIDSGLSFPIGSTYADFVLGASGTTTVRFIGNASSTGDFSIKNTTGDIYLQANNTTATTAKFTTSSISLNEDTTISGYLRVQGSVQADVYVGGIISPTNTNQGYRISHQGSLGCFIDVRNGTDKITYRDYPNATGTINPMFEMNMSSGNFTATGNIIAFGTLSDKRLKENIKPIDSALDKAMRLQGVTFNWKKSDSILEIGEDIGFIAQDVQKVLPELVRENENGEFSLRHQGITPILLEAIKELKAEIEELKLNKCNCNK